MPPIQEVFDALRFAVLPASVAALAVYWLVARLAPKRGGPVAGALAVVAGFAAGNHFRETLSYPLDDLRQGFVGALLHTEGANTVDGWDWLPWLALLALLVGLATRPLPRLVAWAVWLAVAGVAARLLVPPDLSILVPVAFAATVTLSWILLTHVARQHPAGWLPFALSVLCVLASLVLLHAHSARLGDVAMLLSSCFLGIAVPAWRRKATAEGAIPAVAVALPGLLLVGQQNTFSEVPLTSFLLPAIAPLGLALLLIPAISRRWPVLVGLLALLLPGLIAVALAARVESLGGG